MRLSVVIVGLVTWVSMAQGQLFSSSRFFSSGMAFPGPPTTTPLRRRNEDQQQQQPTTAIESNSNPGPVLTPNTVNNRPPQPPQSRQDVPSSNFRPVHLRNPNQQEKIAPPVPLSLVGQKPEEFFALAQQRQQEQQKASPQQTQLDSAIPDNDDKEEHDSEDALKNHALVPRLEQPVHRPQPKQRRPHPERPVERRQQEIERPEPSSPLPIQHRSRPNYPAGYKPRPQQVNAYRDEGQRRPPYYNLEDEEEEEEEDEVKPDKLQLLLQKSGFSCVDKKDGYYADEELDCEVFHYCQDRTRHSWTCPDGASFHQVHLICMPVAKDNICKKSSKFHFVNDYLYKAIEDEDGSDSGLYADRYYPEGYEHGVPFDMEEVVHDRPNYQSSNRHQAALANKRRPQHGGRQKPQHADRFANDNRKGINPRRPVIPSIEIEDDDEDIPFHNPLFRNNEDDFDRRGRPQPELDDKPDD